MFTPFPQQAGTLGLEPQMIAAHSPNRLAGILADPCLQAYGVPVSATGIPVTQAMGTPQGYTPIGYPVPNVHAGSLFPVNGMPINPVMGVPYINNPVTCTTPLTNPMATTLPYGIPAPQMLGTPYGCTPYGYAAPQFNAGFSPLSAATVNPLFNTPVVDPVSGCVIPQAHAFGNTSIYGTTTPLINQFPHGNTPLGYPIPATPTFAQTPFRPVVDHFNPFGIPVGNIPTPINALGNVNPLAWNRPVLDPITSSTIRPDVCSPFLGQIPTSNPLAANVPFTSPVTPFPAPIFGWNDPAHLAGIRTLLNPNLYAASAINGRGYNPAAAYCGPTAAFAGPVPQYNFGHFPGSVPINGVVNPMLAPNINPFLGHIAPHVVNPAIAGIADPWTTPIQGINSPVQTPFANVGNPLATAAVCCN